jgi:predicted dehydrogenase
MTMTLNAGIIGLGVGAQHARAVAAVPDCNIKWLCDFDPGKLEELRPDFPQAQLTANAEDVLTDPDVAFVVIASFDHMHTDQVVMALEHGKHVLVEKPLCQTQQELDRIVDALDRFPNLTFQSNLILRRSPRLIELKQAIEAGDFGEIYYIEADYAYGRLYKITEGWRGKIPYYSVMAGGGIHVIDIVLWLTGKSVREVQGYGSRIATRDSAFAYDDFQVALLRMSEGLIAKVSANFACIYPHNHLFAIYGTKKSFVQNALGAAYLTSRDPASAPVMVTASPWVAKGAFIPRIVEAIRGRAEPEISRRELLDSMRVCLAIERSIHDGQAVKVT